MGKYCLDNLREAYFYKENEKVIPGEFIREIYNPLEELINLNREIVCRRFKGECTSESKKRDAEKLHKEVKKEMIGKKGHALLVYDNGILHFDIKSRTNFDETVTKKPNIVYLSGDRNTLILREARTYDNALVHGDARSEFKKNYKWNVPTDNKEWRKKKIQDNDIFSVPEPRLVLGLEQIHNELDIRRIIPIFKVVDVHEKICLMLEILFYQ